MTLALSLAAADAPDDVRAPEQYARSAAGRRAREESLLVVMRDREWAESLRSDDPRAAHDAFRRIVDEYADRLIRFAYGFVKSADTARDLVQDVFLRVWERRGAVRPDDSFQSYLFTSVRHAALDFLKRRAVELRYASSAARELAGNDAPAFDAQLDADTMATAVRAALVRLSERRRTALHLRYEAQLPFSVVAEVMGLSEKAAQHLVKRAVDELRGYLGL